MYTVHLECEKNMKALLSKYRKPLMGLAAIFILVYHTYAKFLMRIPFLGEAEAFISRILC